MYCVHCGAENPAVASYCRSCGQPLGISRRRRWPVAPDDAMQKTVRAGPDPLLVLPVQPVAELTHHEQQAQKTARVDVVSVRVKEPEPQVIRAPQTPTPAPALEAVQEETSPKQPRHEHRALFHLPNMERPPEQISPPAAEESADEEPREVKPSLFQRLAAWIKERRERRQNERAERHAALAQQKREQDAAAAAGREEKQTTAETSTKAAAEPDHTGPRSRLLRRAHRATASVAALESETATPAFEFSEAQLVDMLFSPSSDDDPAVWGESPENLEKKRSSDIDAKKVAQIALVIGAGAVIIILVAEFAFA